MMHEVGASAENAELHPPPADVVEHRPEGEGRHVQQGQYPQDVPQLGVDRGVEQVWRAEEQRMRYMT
jgi:hypothetical protein